VLDGVDVTDDEGTIFALLGPNGAGKTTIVRILTTLLPADAGELRVAGHDLRANPDGVRATIGVTGQFSALDELLTGEENLQVPSAATSWRCGSCSSNSEKSANGDDPDRRPRESRSAPGPKFGDLLIARSSVPNLQGDT
jgi:ABC-type branched-subunit amino acid transport system ATPase component